jgi:hypothetical protein
MRLPISKVTRAKWTGSVAQPVECLLFKFEALSSNPFPPKRIIKKEQKEHLSSLTVILTNTIC